MTLTPSEIAEAVGAPTTAFKPLSGNLSTLFSWFGNAETLCVIAGKPQMKAQDWDKGFSHALGHLGDRDLIVVFPPAGAKAVAERLPFLEVPARVYALDDHTVTPQPPMRPADVLADYKG